VYFYTKHNSSIFHFQLKQDNSSHIKIRLSTSIEVDEPESHQPDMQSPQKQLLTTAYHIFRNTTYFFTSLILAPDPKPGLGITSEYLERSPEIEHDFFEVAKSMGYLTDGFKRSTTWTSSCYIAGPLTDSIMESIVKTVDVALTQRSGELRVMLDRYFKGGIDRIEPYYHWHHVYEICVCSAVLGNLGKNTDEVAAGNQVIDLKFIRCWGNAHRHAEFHKHHLSSMAKLTKDPKRAQLVVNKSVAKGHYRKNLRHLVQSYLSKIT
jgi:hypothetical protein